MVGLVCWSDVPIRDGWFYDRALRVVNAVTRYWCNVVSDVWQPHANQSIV